MNILITGGAGFQGSHLAEHLLAKGHQVTILNTSSSNARANIKQLNKKVSRIWGSTTNQKLVDKVARNQDVIFHLAAHINTEESRLYPEKVIKADIEGALSVLAAVRKYGNRLIFVSSWGVYGDDKNDKHRMSEDSRLSPNSPYAASKASIEQICHSYQKTFGIQATIIRPFNVFGERQKPGKFGALIPILVTRALTGKKLEITGDGEQARDYLHISDMINAYTLVLKNPSLNGKLINFASGKKTKVKDIAEYIAKKLGTKVTYIPARPGEAELSSADIRFAKSLGWRPRVDIWDGIDQYIAWAKTSLDH